ncbi:hypothetical protein D3C77_269730 [compost metagenome]
MSPEDRDHIQEMFGREQAKTMANLIRAHKAERDARIFRGLALYGWLIVIGLALQWGMSS